LLDEERIGRQLEALRAVRLQPKQCQVAVHGALRQSGFVRQAATRPVRLAAWLSRQCGIDQLRDLILAGTARSPGLELVMQSGNAMLGKAFAPQRYGWTTDLVASRHRAVGLAVHQTQNHLRTTRQCGRKALRSSDRLKLLPVLRRYRQLDCRP